MAKHVLQIPFRDENDKEEAMRVLRDIRNGFKLGVENPENLPLNLEWKRMETYTIKERIFVNEHLTEQLKLGKMDTLKKGEIPENYIFIHPIDKETGDKINHQTKKGRICRDATKSREGVYNLNPLTPDEHVAFNTLPYKQDVARIFVKAQRNCWIFKCDFKDSFRQLATAPSEWLKACYYYMGWNIKDCVDLYGTRGASKRMQEVSVLIARAFDHWVRKHKLSKDEEFFNLCYIDDHFATIKCASFERAKQIMNYFLIFLKKVGIVESEHKREGPAQVMKIIGLIWCSKCMLVGIAEGKRIKLLFGFLVILVLKRMIGSEYESLIGRMRWANQLRWPAPIFMYRLQDKLNVHKQKYGAEHYKQEMVTFSDWECKDIRWNFRYLHVIGRVPISELMRPIPSNEDIAKMRVMYTDGATNGQRGQSWRPGIGAYFEGYWGYAVIPHRWLTQYVNQGPYTVNEPHIFHFEMMAIFTAIKAFQHLFKPQETILVRCDNEGVVGAIINKRGTDAFTEDALRYMAMENIIHNHRQFILPIGTKENFLADDLSRFEVSKFKEHCKEYGFPFQPKPTPMIVPEIDIW